MPERLLSLNGQTAKALVGYRQLSSVAIPRRRTPCPFVLPAGAKEDRRLLGTNERPPPPKKKNIFSLGGCRAHKNGWATFCAMSTPSYQL